ncbi:MULTISPECIES: PID-CTERM protein-sorting domain-containing protein [Aequorivita]|uniref:Signal peptidase n=2 Tax=Aequorivita TaxID=153265 RepID=A0AB35YRW7_9FLAO|nr:hypothetical protein [Aequorivita sp. Ant34-E75]WGF93496.1 hypothetical protein QCQ61_04710 [Aequorivita sp. Ant34-E75]
MLSNIYLLMFLVVQAREDVPPPNDPPPPGPQLPIDDSLWILIVAGLIYGIYIVYKHRKAINKAS